MIYKKEDLYARLTTLFGEVLVLGEDIKQLKKDFSYNKKENPTGLPKELVTNVTGAAKLKAKNDFEEKKDKAMAVFREFEELEGYND